MTIGPQFLGHTVINHLLGELKASVVSVALLAEAVGATILAYLIFGERPGSRSSLGGALVLAGVAVTVLAESARRARRSSRCPRSRVPSMDGEPARDDRGVGGGRARGASGRRLRLHRRGAGAERTLADNEAAFERMRVWPRMLRASGSPDPHTEILGMPLAFPVAIAPWAFQSAGAPRRGTGHSARRGRDGHPDVRLLDRARQARGHRGRGRHPVVAALHLARPRAHRRAAPPRARRGVSRGRLDGGRPGARAAASRHAERVRPAGRARRHAPGVRPEHLLGRPRVDPRPGARHAGARERCAATRRCRGRRSSTAPMAIVVSNHGGRQLDRAPATLEALPGVVAAVDGRVPVLMDGGVRRWRRCPDRPGARGGGGAGGASGRVGSRGGGAGGVEAVLGFLRDGFVNAMANAGCRTVADIDAGLLQP